MGGDDRDREAIAETLVSDSGTPATRPGRPTAIAAAGTPAGLLEVDPAHYAIEGELGRGGMGRIVVARDRRLDRIVALKLLREDTPTLRGRFEREARVTARLQHPAIVPVYEAGRLADEPFYAMRLVSGRPLDAVIDGESSLPGRLALLPSVIAVAEALAYAHDRGIVHRDVKPQNVLVGRFGETVLIDWGLAKDLAGPREEPLEKRPRVAVSGPLTVAGDVMGTPAYMPPEQAAGGEVGEPADVYALGAVLYHLLAGRPPYVGSESWDVVDRVQAAPPEPLVSLAPETPRDLLAIVDKAMARKPGDRYPTAKELAEDLRRFQAGQLVGVHEYTAWEHGKRFLRKNQGAAVVAGVAVLVLLAIGVLTMQRVAEERGDAMFARDQAQLRAVEAEKAGERAEEAGKKAKDALLELLEEQGRSELLNGRGERAAVLLAEAYRGGRDSAGLRLLLASAMRSLDARRYRWLAPEGKKVWALVGSGKRAVVLYSDETAALFDAERGDVLPGLEDQAVSAAAVSLDGARVAIGRPDGQLEILDPAGKRLASLLASDHAVLSLDFSPDGGQLAVADDAGTVLVLDARQGARIAVYRGRGAVRVAGWTAGGALLLLPELRSAEPARAATLVDARTGKLVVSTPLPEGVPFAMDASGRRLAVADERGVSVREGGKLVARLESAGGIAGVSLSADGHLALVVDDAGGLALWDVGQATRRFRVPGPFAEAELLPDGRLLALGSDDVLRVLEGERGVVVGSVEVGHAQAHLASPGGDSTLLFADTGVSAVQLGPAGFATILTGEDAGAVVARDTTLVVGARRIEAGGAVAAAALGPAGLVVAGLRDGKLKVWDAAGKLVLDRVTAGVPSPVAVSATHALAVVAGVPELVSLDGNQARTLAAGEVFAAAFSPDGQHVAVAGGPRTARVFSVQSGLLVADLDGLAAAVVALAWDPRAEALRLVTTSADGQVRVWETRSGRLLAGFDVRGMPLAPVLAGSQLTVGVEGRRLRFRLDEEARAPIDVSSRVGARARYRIERGRLLPR